MADYVGSELATFALARNWKAYLRTLLSPFMGRSVLEIGAGLGSATQALCGDQVERWLCVEPDLKMAEELERKRDSHELPACCEVLAGSLSGVAADERFHTILYIDVLEHIREDAREVLAASKLLAANGTLCVVAPAHQWLFSPFDDAIGHYRRYNKRSLRELTPMGLVLEQLRYVDGAGFALSALNRYLLRSSSPTRFQIRMWDGLLVPLSRVLDAITAYSVGRSVGVVWRRREDTPRSRGE